MEELEEMMRNDPYNHKEIIEDLLKFHQPLLFFDETMTNERLILHANRDRIERMEYYEIFPVSKAIFPSKICSSLRMKWLDLRSSSYNLSYDCSMGLLSTELYRFDFNLFDHIGKCEESIGIHFHKNIDQLIGFIDVWSNSRKIQRINRTLFDKDCLTLLITPSIDSGCLRYDEKLFHLFINDEHIITIPFLPNEFGDEACAGVVPSPNTGFEIHVLTDRHLLTRLLSEVFVEKGEENIFLQSSEEKEQGKGFGGEEERTEEKTSAQVSSFSGPPERKLPVPSFFPQKSSLTTTQLPWNRPKSSKPLSMENEDVLLCCICLGSPKSVLLIPCKHLCLCDKCGSEGTKSNLQYCPICRKKILDRIKVYL